MNIKIIEDINEFNKLKNGWSDLLKNSEDNQIFYTWSWADTQIRKLLLETDELFIVLLEENGKYIAIAPLKITNIKILYTQKRLLTNLTDTTADYNTIIIDKSFNYKKILEKIIDIIDNSSNKWDIVKLINLNEKYNMPQNMYEVMKNKNFPYLGMYVSTVCPYIKYSNMDNKINRKHIRNLLRRKRRLEKSNTVEIFLNEDFDNEIFDQLLQYKNSKYTKGVLRNTKVADFYRELAKIIPDSIHFAYMKVNNHVVAIHFGFKDKNKIYYYIPASDPDPKYQNEGVGMTLLNEIINFEKEYVDTFDFLRGNESYKFNWTDSMTQNYELWAISPKKRGFITAIYLNLFILFTTVPFFRNLHQKIRKFRT